MDISERIRSIGINQKALAKSRMEQYRKMGKPVIALDVGEPDFITPDFIIKAAAEAMRNGYTHYTPAEGMEELRQAICEKMEKENNVRYDSDEIIVCAGAKQAISDALFAICNKGDEIIIPTPCWDSYPNMVKLAQGVPVYAELHKEDGYVLTADILKKYITPRTKCIILNNPHNPTGCVYSEAAQKEIGHLACEYGLYIISDEIYEYLVYEGKCTSTAAINEEIKNRTITVNGLSKSFAMTGWRIGYAAGPKEIIQAMKTFQSYTTSNACSIAQKAGVEAIKGSKASVEAMIYQFDLRRRFLTDRLREAGIDRFVEPKGAFYVFPDISSFFGKSYEGETIKNADDFASFLLEQADVSVNSGSLFMAPSGIRISYSASMENLSLGMQKIRRALSLLK